MATEEFKIRFTEAGVKEVVRGFNDTIKASETAQEAIDRINRELNATTRYASRAQRSYENYARATNAVDKAQRAGIISAGEAAARQRSLGVSYQSQLRPIQTLISKIEGETVAWRTNKTERIATLRTIQQVVGLQRIGINATDAEIAAIQRANQAYSQQRQTIADNAQARRNAERIMNNAGSAQEQAAARVDRYTTQLADARQRGIITAQQEADAVGRLTRQYAEQFDPLVKSERLQRERLNYQRGLFQSGSNLAQVERELTRMQARGVAVDAARAASLRRNAREADRLQRAYQGITSAGGLMNRVIGGVGLALAASKLTRDLDAVTTINNRLTLVASSMSNANRLFAETSKLALDTRSDMMATVEGFSRIARSTKQIGLSQRAALNLTKAVNQSLKISGASAQEAAATVVQFGQALASNRLGGDELRSVLEQAPRLSQAVVDGINLLNKTDPTQLPKKLQAAMKKSGDINIGVLRDMAKQGLLTTKVVSAAVLTQTDVLEREFQKTIPTISESFTNLNTKWLVFLNDFDKTSGIAAGIAKSIKFIGNNLGAIITLATIFGGIVATVFVVNQVKAFYDIIRSLPTIFGLTTLSVDRNRVALDAETAALARNSLAQKGNGMARGLGAAGGAGRAVQGGGAAVTAVAAGMGAATPKVSMLTAAVSRLGVVLSAVLSIAKAGAIAGASIFAGLAVGVFAAGGAMLYLKNRTREASDELLIYGEGTTQRAIKGQISYRDVAVGVFNTLIGKTDEITLSQLEASRQVKDAKISDEKEATDEQIAAMQKKDDATAQHTVRTMSVYANMNEGIGKDAATLAGDLVGIATLISGAFIAGFKAIGLTGEQMLGNLTDDFASFYNKSVVPLMNMAKKVGVGDGATEINVVGRGGRQRNYDAKITELGKEIWTEAAKARTATQELTARAISSTSARRQGAGRGALDGPGVNTVTDPPGKDKKDGEAKKLASAYRQLRDELDPLAKITEDYEKDQLTLNKALSAGLLTQTYHTELMGRLTKRYNEARDPIGKMIADQEKENAILLLNVDAREAASLALQRQMQLERQFGRELTPEEKARVVKSADDDTQLARVTAMNDAVAEANRLRGIEAAGLGRNALLLQAEADARSTIGDALRQNLPGAKEAYEKQVQLNLAFAQQKQLADQVEATFTRLTSATMNYAQEIVALNTLLEQGRITTERYERELRSLASAQLGDNLDLSSGVARGIYAIKAQSEDLASGIQKTFEDAYQKIGDGFVSIFTGDEFNVGDLFKSITANLARTLYNGVMDPMVSKVGASMGMSGFGGAQDTAGQTAAANTVQAAWQAAATNMQMSWQTALTTMGTASNTFAMSQQTLTGQVVATQVAGVTQGVTATVAGETTKNGVVAAGAAVTATAETAKTGAVVAGASVRTAAEVAAAGTSKTLTIGDAIMTIGANAVKAATGAYAAISSIPVIGPFLAPAVAAGALAAVFGLGKTLFSAEQGVGSVANDGDLYSLHKKEMVLPAQYATPLRDMLTTPGGRDVAEGPAGRSQEVAVPDVNVDANTTVNNVLDPQMALDAINTTAGTRTILNVIQSNPAAVRRALGV